MVSLVSLVLPILISAVVVFLLSWIIHMFLKYHTGDFQKLSNEDGVADALRKFEIPPGDYMTPYAGSSQTMKDPAYLEKFKKGPVLVMTVLPAGQMAMGKSLLQWFIYCIVVSVFAGYITAHAVPAGADYLQVFRFAGCTAFAGYALGLWQDSIWYRRKWSTTVKFSVDGLIFALFTAGIFGSMWPKG
ncbi:MAG TPA: hypothetical protein VFH88_02300 [Candidatus Krumholzibacteria bacterium]|nr:hypothetical protein [Candidatus Krumholzibacteria bacterium]